MKRGGHSGGGGQRGGGQLQVSCPRADGSKAGVSWDIPVHSASLGPTRQPLLAQATERKKVPGDPSLAAFENAHWFFTGPK